MPFSALLEAYENVTEVRTPVNLIWRVLTTFSPRMVDEDGNEIQDHPYHWMCDKPDGRTPFSVWITRFIKSTKIYDAPSVYVDRPGNEIKGLHYIDGSTLFLIVDEYGNTPDPTPMNEYVAKKALEEQSGVSKAHPSFGALIPGTPTTAKELVEMMLQREMKGQEIPEKVPAFTQIIKGTPFSFWSSDQIWYRPQNRRMNSPYGESFIEQAWSWIMIIVNITSFELGHYRTGNMPEGFATLPSNMYGTPDRILLAEQMYNSRMGANAATERNRVRFFPDGTKWIPTKKADFPTALYNQAWHNILHTIGIPPSEFGDIPGSGLGGKGFKEGAASDLSRNTLNPNRQFVMSLFNEFLELDGVDDATFDLGYPTEEIDPDKLKTSVYEGLIHATYTLNDALGQLGLNPVEGSVDSEGNPDPNHIANKHLLVAGANVYVVEDMQVGAGGVAEPPAKPQQASGAPADTHEGEIAEQHTPEDTKTLESAIKAIMEKGQLTTTTWSLPIIQKESIPGAILAEVNTANVTPSQPYVTPQGVDPDEFAAGMKEEQEHVATVGNDQNIIRQIVLDHLREDPKYYSHLRDAEAKITKVSIGIDLLKHCGVCPEDDEYFNAPISRELKFDLPSDPDATHEGDGRTHANDVEVIAMCPPGLPPKPALWKPVGGENDMLQERIGGAQYVREEAAYLLDRCLGFYLVPVAYVAKTDDDEVGAAIYYTFGMGKPRDVNTYAPEWIERAAILDYIISQQDRGNRHNYGSHPDDDSRPILFDNGLSFPTDPDLYCESPFCETMLNQPLSDASLLSIQKCLSDHATWTDIRQLLGDEATDKAIICAQRLFAEKAITPYHHEEDESETSGDSETTPIMTDIPTK